MKSFTIVFQWSLDSIISFFSKTNLMEEQVGLQAQSPCVAPAIPLGTCGLRHLLLLQTPRLLREAARLCPACAGSVGRQVGMVVGSGPGLEHQDPGFTTEYLQPGPNWSHCTDVVSQPRSRACCWEAEARLSLGGSQCATLLTAPSLGAGCGGWMGLSLGSVVGDMPSR